MNSLRLCQDLRADVFPGGEAVFRDFHEQPRGDLGQNPGGHLAQKGDDHQVEEVDPQGPVRSQGIGHQGEDDHRAGRTRDQHRQHGDHQPVPGALQDAGGHHRGHAAAVAQDEGDDGLAVEPQEVHDVVHEEGHPGQVAAVLQEGQADEKGQQVGQHDGHPPEDAHEQALHHAVGQVMDPQPGLGQLLGRGQIAHQEVLGVLAEPEDHLEEGGQDRHQQDVAPESVGGDLIQALAPVGFGRRA